VSEWPIEHAWKACVPQGTAGSNPALSATQQQNPLNASTLLGFDFYLKKMILNNFHLLLVFTLPWFYRF
jgi:hypothetical protein